MTRTCIFFGKNSHPDNIRAEIFRIEKSDVSKFVKHTTKSLVSNHTTSTSAVKDQSFIIASDSPIYEGTCFMDRMKLIQKTILCEPNAI